MSEMSGRARWRGLLPNSAASVFSGRLLQLARQRNGRQRPAEFVIFRQQTEQRRLPFEQRCRQPMAHEHDQIIPPAGAFEFPPPARVSGENNLRLRRHFVRQVIRQFRPKIILQLVQSEAGHDQRAAPRRPLKSRHGRLDVFRIFHRYKFIPAAGTKAVQPKFLSRPPRF
jgi:hypothetical protein